MACWSTACNNFDSANPTLTAQAPEADALLTVVDQNGQTFTVMDIPFSVATVAGYTYHGGLDLTTEAPLEMSTASMTDVGLPTAAASMTPAPTISSDPSESVVAWTSTPLSTQAIQSFSLDSGASAMPTFSSSATLSSTPSSTAMPTTTTRMVSTTETSETISPTPTAPVARNDSASKGLATGAAIGITAAGLALLAILITLFTMCRRRSRRSRQRDWAAPADSEDMWAPTSTPPRSFNVQTVGNVTRKPVSSVDSSSILFPGTAYKNGDSFVTGPSALGSLYVANGGVWSPALGPVNLAQPQPSYHTTPSHPSHPFAPSDQVLRQSEPYYPAHPSSDHWRTHSQGSYYSYYGQPQASMAPAEAAPFGYPEEAKPEPRLSSSSLNPYGSLGPRPRPAQTRARLLVTPEMMDGKDQHGVALPPMLQLSPELETMAQQLGEVPSTLCPGQVLQLSSPPMSLADHGAQHLPTQFQGGSKDRSGSPHVPIPASNRAQTEPMSKFSDATMTNPSRCSSSKSYKPDLQGPYPPRAGSGTGMSTVAPLNIRKRSTDSCRSRASSLAEILAGPPSRPSRALRPPSEPGSATPRHAEWPVQEIAIVNSGSSRPRLNVTGREKEDSRRWTEEPSSIAYLTSTPNDARGCEESDLSPSMSGSAVARVVWPPVLLGPTAKDPPIHRDYLNDDDAATSSGGRLEDLVSKGGTAHSSPDRPGLPQRHVGPTSPFLRSPREVTAPASHDGSAEPFDDGVLEAFGIIDRARQQQIQQQRRHRIQRFHGRNGSEEMGSSGRTTSSMSLTFSMKRTQAWLAANHYEHF